MEGKEQAEGYALVRGDCGGGRGGVLRVGGVAMKKHDVDGDLTVEQTGADEMVVKPCGSMVVASADGDSEEPQPHVLIVIDGRSFSMRTREQMEHVVACLRCEADRVWPENAPRAS